MAGIAFTLAGFAFGFVLTRLLDPGVVSNRKEW